MSRLHAFGLAFLLLAAPLASAQEAEAPPSQTILCFVLPIANPDANASSPAALDFTLSVDGKPSPLSLGVGGLSAPIIRPAAANFTLYRALPPAAYSPPPGAPPPAPPPAVATATFPAEWNTVLLLIGSDRSGTQVRIIPFDLGVSRLPPGRLGLFNLTDQTYALRLGSAQDTVAPRSLALLAIPRPADRDVSTHVLQFARGVGSGWVFAGRQTLTLDAASRTFTLLLPGENDAMPQLIHVPVPQPQPPASATVPAAR